ncbi:MAG: sulfatase-like hydrolase/transferase [Planctomycetaceae bacterium]|nr:sulfatase-like hydrolase/transferase [Planctomycetaceae bacterium]
MKQLISFVLTILATVGLQAEDDRPNIILVLADDLGAKELSSYGNTVHHTPCLDQMAAEGARFETFYAMPLCTPTRVCLMTGQYGFHNGFLGMQNPAFRPLPGSPQADIGNHFTHADLLKAHGYATAQIGKWQLSGKLPTLIRDTGFDEYCMWAYDHNLPEGIQHPSHERAGGNTSRYWHPSIVQNGEYRPTEPGDYGPDIFNQFALDFARRHKDQPFFIYYTSLLTHGPHLETPDPNHPGQHLPATFRSNLEYLDYLMGQLLDGLKAEGLDENTVVIFVGDNGTGGSGKGSVTEPGARVPCIIRGPGVKPGLVTRAVGDLTDFLPTLAEYAQAKLPADHPFDGHSLVPVLTGQKEKHRDWIYSHLDDGRILRDERWLLQIGKGGKNEQFFDCGESRDGSGYRDVTDSTDPEVQQARARFASILAGIPVPKPHPGMESRGDNKPQKPIATERNERFRQRDQNSDGFIDHKEFLATIAGSDQKAGEARFRKLDTDGDDRISLEEFRANGAKK